MANFIVGDIQGCYSALRTLLDKACFDPATDHLWAAGDLVARGPESLQTIQYLMSMGDNFNTVLGNHDLHFLAIASGIKPAKAGDKLESLLNCPELPSYIAWLRKQPLALQVTPNTLLAHAGLYPCWSFKKALKLSQEVSEQLQSDDWKLLLKNMYGSEPSFWDKEHKSYKRWRFIINAFTRMRFLDQNKQLEFINKNAPENAPSFLTPWFNIKNKKMAKDEKVIFGHWAALQGETGSHRFIGLDTGYIWGKHLTLLHLEEKRKVSIAYK